MMDHFCPEKNTGFSTNGTYLRLRRTQYFENELMVRMKIKISSRGDVFVFSKHEDEGTGPRLAKQFEGLSQPIYGQSQLKVPAVISA